MLETNLAQTVSTTNDTDSAHDTNVKYLLADKQILSRILKYTIEEFREMSIEDIIGCIGDDIEIGTRPDAGLSNLGGVKETITEDKKIPLRRSGLIEKQFLGIRKIPIIWI